MPAYNFMERWMPKILDGSKAQTIRRKRKRATRPGDMLALYVGQRTRQCRLIGRAPCVRVTPVVIYPYSYFIKVNGFILAPQRTNMLAKRDGFDNLVEFFDFFKRYGDSCLEDFEIIEWDPKQLKQDAQDRQDDYGTH